jgi:peptidoglycan/LPS O-acetylase OafA/YrhL
MKDGIRSVHRPDIDGLRAVAVLCVLFYHVGFGAFAGGFVGVDVFFVISGYLITQLIKLQIEDGTFSFRTFYIRRARRLLPALLATTAVSIIAAAILLSPQLLKEFGASVVYASLSLSNLFFYRQSGYFDTDAALKPLLHTWSLSVEEQFYLVWPALIVILLLMLPKKVAPLLILVLGCLSFLLADHYAAHTSAVFYLTPFRVFEFALGASVIWVREHLPASNVVREILLLAGLALIILSAAGHGGRVYSDVAVLAPCLGAALALYAGEARYSGALLTNRVAVGVGLISYSLYLCHWPLLVFFKYTRADELTVAEMWAVVACCMVLAALMYAFVEKPFRRRGTTGGLLPDRTFLLGYTAALLLAVGVAVDMWWSGGWLWRFPASIRRQISAEALQAYRDYTWRAFKAAGRPLPAGGKRILVIGDSQAADVVNMLIESGRVTLGGISTMEVDMQCQSLISWAPQQFDALSKPDKAACQPYLDGMRTLRSVSDADDVILAFNWDDRGIPFIDAAVSELHRRGVRKVFVVGRKSQGMGGPDVVLRYGILSGVERYSASRKNPIAWAANAKIAKLASDFVYVDVMSQVCPSERSCKVLTDSLDVIFFDGSHLTPQGARYVGGLLAKTGALDF